MNRDSIHSAAISVIIPAHNASATLRACLDAVLASEGLSFECIVVDDGSTDGTGTIARDLGVRVLELAKGPFGPAYARNRGAEVARGDIIFFVDADVVLAPGALDLVDLIFRERPDLAAVFGSYDASPKAEGIVSRYRNLLHHFVHQNGNPDASTFWAGCGAIRRSVFEKIEGFDEKRFARPSIEDIELGYRLRQAGYRILLDKRLQGTHLKQWNLSSMVRTDITCRAAPWSRLILETKTLPNDLNLKMGQRISFALVALACALIPLALAQPVLLAVSAVALLGVAVLNRNLYGFFFRQQGTLFTAASISLHLLYYLYSGVCYSWVWGDFHLKRGLFRPKSQMAPGAESPQKSPKFEVLD
jgi:GT2 family glycosyltransferase